MTASEGADNIQGYARLAGVLGVLTLVAGGFGEAYVPSAILVSGDPAATVRNVVALESLFRWGFAGYLVEALCDAGLIEGERRGLYGGAVGYLGYDGNLDTAITIRSAVLKDGQAHVHTGAGIVAGSVPESEFEETEHKAAALRRAIEMAAGVPEMPRPGSAAAADTEPQPAPASTGAGASR